MSVGLVRDLATGLKSLVSGRENTTRNVSVDDSPGERGHTDAGVNLGSVHHGGVTPEDIVRVGDSGNNSNTHDGGVTPENIVRVGDSGNISNTHDGSVPPKGMLKGVASVVKNVTQGAREGAKNIVRGVTSEVKNVTLEATDAVEETVQSGVETVAPVNQTLVTVGVIPFSGKIPNVPAGTRARDCEAHSQRVNATTDWGVFRIRPLGGSWAVLYQTPNNQPR
ncbi:unnamed protein product [Timema podura]|uniref:Uncharacterized protein n=1 Tax=Timema podura TaxID=61482 RepID=A0ABN7PR44_TIMPD|nr:unnamed protein product [Timema podura]